MANRYWVGNGGNINDPAHWSTTSGGAGGASVPGSLDIAYFNSLSFTLGGQTVVQDIAWGPGGMTWSGVTNSPTFDFNGFTFTSNGTTAFSASMSLAGTNRTIVKATSGTFYLFDMTIYNLTLNASITLGSNLNVDNLISHTAGTFATSGYVVNCGQYTMSGTSTKALTLGATIFSSLRTVTITSSSTTVTAGTSKFILGDASNFANFVGGGKNFYDLEFADKTNGFDITSYSVAGGTFHNIKLCSGTLSTFSVTNFNFISGYTSNAKRLRILGFTITALTGAQNGPEYSIVWAANVAGAGSINFNNSDKPSALNIVGNVTFTNELYLSGRYWIGNTENWDNVANWAWEFGGSGGASIPSGREDFILDENSFSANGQSITLTTGRMFCRSIDFTAITKTGISLIKGSGNTGLQSCGNILLNANIDISAITFYWYGITTYKGNFYINTYGIIINLTISQSGFTRTDFTINLQSNISYLPGIDKVVFYSHGYDINCLAQALWVDSNIYLEDSVITILALAPAGIDFSDSVIDAGTSKFIVMGTLSIASFIGLANTFYDLDWHVLMGGVFGIFHNVLIDELKVDSTWNYLQGSFNNLEISKPGAVLKCSNITLSGTLTANGTLGNLITLKNSVVWNIVKATGIVHVNYCSLTNSHASGGAAFYAENSFDGGGNTGWIFGAPPVTTMDVNVLPLIIDELKLVMPTWVAQSRCSIEVLELRESVLAEAGTTSTSIKITAHGSQPDDFIVNSSRVARGAERASRLVSSIGTDDDTIGIDTAIGDMQEGDTIRLFSYREIIGSIKPESLQFNRRLGGQSELRFVYIGTNSSKISVGQYVRASFLNEDGDNNQLFRGILIDITRMTELSGPSSSLILFDCKAKGYNSICARRTIRCFYEAGITCGTIVQQLLDLYLFQEGIKGGTIDVGAILDEDWNSDILSIAEVFDQCASRSGYQWFIDDSGFLQFYQDPDPVPLAPFNIDTEAGEFRDFAELTYNECLDGYTNKIFIVGGIDILGQLVAAGSEDFEEIKELQLITAGTGIHGSIIRDSSIQDVEYLISGKDTDELNGNLINIPSHGLTAADLPQTLWDATQGVYAEVIDVSDPDMLEVFPAIPDLAAGIEFTAEASTDSENIFITTHGQAVGNMIHNATLNQYRVILSITSADAFKVEEIVGQVAGDKIIMNGDIINLYSDVNFLIRNALKKQGMLPKTLTFRTFNTAFNPGQKIVINYPRYAIINESFVIEEIALSFPIGKKDILQSIITCVKRDGDNFSTQRRDSFLEYFGGV